MTAGPVAYTGAAFGQGSGSVVLTSLQCTGNESSLTECSGAIFQVTPPCTHLRDAGVSCQVRSCMTL